MQFPPHEAEAAATLVAACDARATHHALDLGGCETRWREWGEGTPLVLIHGGHGSWMHWIRNIEALALHFRVIVPDLAGFGDSEDFALDAHDPARLSQLVRSLRLGVEHLAPAGPLHLAGFSFGGAVAGLLAPQLPRLQRLALLGCAGHGGRRRDRGPLLDWRAQAGAQRWQALQQNLEAFMLSGPADAMALYVHGQSCERTRFRSKAFSRSPLLLETLQQVDQPVLMVWGDDDVTAVPAEAAQALAQDKPTRDWTLVAGAGHWVQYERPEAINTLLTSWLKAA
ncbi:alpha/beta fold hydrolase [Comamonas endophytica]|uniref:Alpha/beta hydrolase n=1 Tax=Comamonas endophytica TaxID=2949090 RepID=A0ABY6GE86_9BURK|nr:MULTISPECIES: alpha/beta hydrolase [unclassified Acidovorax]MCD2513242.1 alpha/beta hydrolase [Acidovorax sp. D4N7]UYG53414.1 alpha/beta hydrolase [Acidovorax sp. 5MLIR]